MNVTDSGRASTAGNLLVGVLSANVLFYLLTLLVNFVAPGSYDGPWHPVEMGAWIVLDLVMAVALLMLAAAVSEGGLLRVAAVVLVLSTLIELPMWALRNGDGLLHLDRLFWGLSLLLVLALRGLVSAAFVQLTRQTHPWVLPLLATVVLLTVIRVGLSFAISTGAVSPDLSLSPLYRYVMPLLSLFNSGATLVAGFAVRSAVAGAPVRQDVMAAAGLVPPAPEPISPAADFVVGGLLLAVGLGVSVVSFSAASGGGRYVVATGAIGVGIGRIIRGIIRMAKAGAT